MTGGTLTSSFDWPLLEENVSGRLLVYCVQICCLHIVFLLSVCIKQNILSVQDEKIVLELKFFLKYFLIHLLPFVLRQTPMLLI